MARDTTDMKRNAPLWIRRFGWLVILWAGGVAALFGVAQLLKAIMRGSGLA
ncbi:hypothetical protein CAL24_17890 [Bordetella genomosp. 2]|uniref:DUF2474 domain-containing protein n=2 Tax=Bordetella TaxID=517 RepID=A0A261VHS5_9BORD|nr:hypothetical protein CAL24_17890 [Bordetella genomosp. 2]